MKQWLTYKVFNSFVQHNLSFIILKYSWKYVCYCRFFKVRWIDASKYIVEIGKKACLFCAADPCLCRHCHTWQITKKTCFQVLMHNNVICSLLSHWLCYKPMTLCRSASPSHTPKLATYEEPLIVVCAFSKISEIKDNFEIGFYSLYF